MKRMFAVGAVCALLGVAVGSASAQKPLPPKVMSVLGHLEMGLQEMGDLPADPGGHMKKSQELLRKSIDEFREAAGIGHSAHSHDEAPAKKKK